MYPFSEVYNANMTANWEIFDTWSEQAWVSNWESKRDFSQMAYKKRYRRKTNIALLAHDQMEIHGASA